MAYTLKENVYGIGVLNPNMRIFDVIMRTEYGTSYNSYVVKGEKATALLETAHASFFDYYRDNLSQIVEDFSGITYLVMNHNEPDHSGSIEKLLELIPHLKIVVSGAGAIYLKNIVNRPMQVIVAKEGDEIDLGGKTLRFISAPFLHWPDSMFTYLKEDRILFSCDFLGAHYCAPRYLDRNMLQKDKPAYDMSLKAYFDAIFAPFKPYVRQALEKIKPLAVDMVCPGHGPVLTAKGFLPEVVAQYREWSQPVQRSLKRIPLFYCSAYGNTERLASEIREGILEVFPEAEVCCYDLNEHPMDFLAEQINDCDGFMIGSPTINRDAVPPVWMLLSRVDAVGSQKRPAAVFGSYGWSGEAAANIRARLEGLRMQVYAQDFRIVFLPTPQDLNNARAYGHAFAQTMG